MEGEQGDDVGQGGQGDRQPQAGREAHMPQDVLDEGGKEVDIAWRDRVGPEGAAGGGPAPPQSLTSRNMSSQPAEQGWGWGDSAEGTH